MRKTGKGVVSINPNIIDGFFIEHFLEYKTEPAWLDIPLAGLLLDNIASILLVRLW
jgi:hypothetical protein